MVTSLATDLAAELETVDMVDHTARKQRIDAIIGRYLTAPATGATRRWSGDAEFHEAETWQDAYWEARWTGGTMGSLRWHDPIVRVEQQGPRGWETVAVDRGWHLGVFGIDDVTFASRWFLPPLGAPGRWRFVLEANNGQPESTGEGFD